MDSTSKQQNGRGNLQANMELFEILNDCTICRSDYIAV